jgi:hypothetical protein
MQPDSARRGAMDHSAPAEASPSVVTHAETRPQRTPKFVDSPWGAMRQPTGWSLRDLSERTGINAGELSRIERGRSCPTPDQARKLLKAYDRDQVERACDRVDERMGS